MNKDKKLNKLYAAAFFSQFGVLMVCIVLHRIFIHLGDNIGETVLIGGELFNPTAGRLIFLILAAIAFLFLAACASKMAKEGKTFAPFILGCFSGTFLWQCIGEDLCIFSISGEYFITLEEISVLPIAILFIILLVYCYKNNSFDWGIWCTLLAFAVNWYGHFVLIGIYPVFSGLCSESDWYRSVGLIFGGVLFLLSLFLGLVKATTPRQKIVAAILSYYAIAVMAFGIMEA